MEYQNPILTGFYPDPSICRVGNDFYMVNSTFEYLPGIPVFHSTDLINWEQIGHCITRASQMEFPKAKASGGLFAPTIRYHEGTFYVVCTNTSKGQYGNFYVTADDPEGEWSDPIWVDQDGIDPSLLFDSDGSVYFTSNGMRETAGRETPVNVIQQSRMDIETGRLTSGPRVISRGTGGRCAEGPHLYKINGWYYLLLAEGGTETGHMVTILRSASPWGPFEPGPDNPILTARDENRPELVGTGHADLFEDAQGNWWLVFLCYRIANVKYHHLGRETALVPVIWENGWPKAAYGKVAAARMNVPGIRPVEQKSREGEHFRDLFDKEELDLKWNFIREFYDDFRVDTAEHALVMKGKPQTLSDRDCPAFIGRRQCHMEMECRVELEFEPEEEWEEAGITVLCSERAHYDLGMRRTGDGGKLIFHKTVEDMESVTEVPLGESAADESAVVNTRPSGKIELYIDADREQYRFGVIDSGGKREIGSGLVKLLSSEVIWGFTGVYIGMYVTGNGKSCRSLARFKNFRYHGAAERQIDNSDL